MSSGKLRGTKVWISAFLSFIAGVNTFNAVVLMTLQGADFIVEFSISNLTLAVLSALAYSLMSGLAAFVLLGLTVYFMFKGLPVDPNIDQRLSKVESTLTVNGNMLENMQIGFFKRLESTEKVAEDALQRVNISLDEAQKQTSDALEKQRKTLEDAQKESKKNTEIIKKQAAEVSNVRRRVGKIEKALSPAKTKLTSKSRVEELKGVKPRLAEGLKTMDITNVGQFLATDPASIAERTMEIHETVANLQAEAQLLMVPGITAHDAELLVKAGITSRKELANQDPVQLCRAVVNVANTYLEAGKMQANRVPTVDDVWCWIRSARS